MTTKQITQKNHRLWLAAIKPPIYSVAIAPIAVGTAVAFASTRLFNAQSFFTFLGSAILIIAWLNLSNDVFDSETGIDVNKAHSVVNLTGNKSLVFWLANLCLGMGITGILALAWWQQDLTVLGLVLLCCFLGYTYQGPPFRFGLGVGLGDSRAIVGKPNCHGVVTPIRLHGPACVARARWRPVRRHARRRDQHRTRPSFASAPDRRQLRRPPRPAIPM